MRTLSQLEAAQENWSSESLLASKRLIEQIEAECKIQGVTIEKLIEIRGTIQKFKDSSFASSEATRDFLEIDIRMSRLIDTARYVAAYDAAVKHSIMVKRSAQMRKLSRKQRCEFLLYFLPKNTRDPILGDLEVDFAIVRKKFGARRAEFWYATQVVLVFWNVAPRAIKRLAQHGLTFVSGYVMRRFTGG